jgi:GR25 family glycosyltransferase involved in LPS biosynthesis
MLNSISDIKYALYINLADRVDRKQHVEKQMKLIGIPVKRFDAIKLPFGSLGCSASHLMCLQIAKKRGWDHVLICEDDITFTNSELFIAQFNKFLNAQKKWDVVLIAGNNMGPYKAIEDYCVQVTKCATCTGYLVKSDYYDTLINNFYIGMNKLFRNKDKNYFYAVDQYWCLLQRRDLWFLITPLSVIQKEDYSNLANKDVDYTNLMLELDGNNK